MTPLDIDAYAGRSRALDLRGIAWDDVPRHPLSAETLRVLHYMQDIESHTIIYLRTLLSTRAIDDPDVAIFFACWFYEETFHGRALARFL
ncbi:MAG TPA: ferritin-like domain-containing protein, partial [Candidatus Binatia bacterium]|nr:ferritin-like domain-containing protein [Candidatus Binatia bacterium]